MYYFCKEKQLGELKDFFKTFFFLSYYVYVLEITDRENYFAESLLGSEIAGFGGHHFMIKTTTF